MHLAQVSGGLVMIEVHVSRSYCAFETESVFSCNISTSDFIEFFAVWVDLCLSFSSHSFCDL